MRQKTIKEYCDDQIRIWNEQASKDDVIYHLGDMCNYNGTEKDFLPGLMLVQEVNAKVILIMGNNEERVMQYCFENNFEKFRDFCIFAIHYHIISSMFFLSHFHHLLCVLQFL